MKQIVLLSMFLGLQSVYATTFTLNTTVTSPQQNFKVDLDLEIENRVFSASGTINGSITLHHLNDAGQITASEQPITFKNIRVEDLEDSNWFNMCGLDDNPITLDVHYKYILSDMAYIHVYVEHALYPNDIINVSQQGHVKRAATPNNAWMSSPSTLKKSRYSNYSDAYGDPNTWKKNKDH